MTTQNWIEIQELIRLLYLSERTIYKHKKNQVFVAGEHFYRVGEEKIKANIQIRRNNVSFKNK